MRIPQIAQPSWRPGVSVTVSTVDGTAVAGPNALLGHLFGVSLALSADGSTLAVGASAEGSNATGVNGDQSNNAASYSGAVCLYQRSLFAVDSWRRLHVHRISSPTCAASGSDFPLPVVAVCGEAAQGTAITASPSSVTVPSSIFV